MCAAALIFIDDRTGVYVRRLRTPGQNQRIICRAYLLFFYSLFYYLPRFFYINFLLFSSLLAFLANLQELLSRT